MAERTQRRPAGVTRITDVRQVEADDVLTAANLASFVRSELERIAADRALSLNGTDAELRTRILNDLSGG